MKSAFTLCTMLVLLVGSSLFGQTDWKKYDAIVAVASTDPVELSKLITKDFATPKEKAEAIYYWLAKNVAYDHRLLEKRMKAAQKGPEKMTKSEIQERIDDEISYTLKKKKGICQNYAYTFQALCRHADIPCEFVGGYSKTDPGASGSRGGRHAWNAVDWGEGWKLVDATYGSGFSREGKFQFSFEPGFFAQDHQMFALNHLPHDEKWQLLDQANDEDTYKDFPILGRAAIAYGLTGLSPTTNELEVKKGEDLEILFQSDAKLPDIFCGNLRTHKKVAAELRQEGNQYKIVVDTNDLRNGTYGFWADQQLLLVYKVRIQ